MKEEIPFEEYKSTLAGAEELYNVLFGEPKTHKEVADKFNKVGLINRHILKTLKNINHVDS